MQRKAAELAEDDEKPNFGTLLGVYFDYSAVFSIDPRLTSGCPFFMLLVS